MQRKKRVPKIIYSKKETIKLLYLEMDNKNQEHFLQ